MHWQGSSRVLSASERAAAFQSFKQSQRHFSGKALDTHNGPQTQGSQGTIDPAADRGMVLPFEPIIMTFQDVHYWVNCPPDMQGRDLPNVNEKNGKQMLELLRGISGAFRPGFMTCLMGVSGAGELNDLPCHGLSDEC